MNARLVESALLLAVVFIITLTVLMLVINPLSMDLPFGHEGVMDKAMSVFEELSKVLDQIGK